MGISKKKKQDILPDEIKANIYDKIQLLVDFHGITRLEIEKTQEKIKDILSSDIYSRQEDEFLQEELEAYGERHDISQASLRRFYDIENVVRYYSKDKTEIITISRMFISISLNYKVAHKLKDNIKLIAELVELFSKEGYFEVEGVYLIKSDSIYCKSLYRLYQCYDKNMFGDAGYLLQKKENKILPESTAICNRFKYDIYDVSIIKSVIKGITTGEQEIYEGRLKTIGSFEVLNEETYINIKETMEELNNISFKLFMSHITSNFANDLILGKTDKVKEGVNINEQR